MREYVIEGFTIDNDCLKNLGVGGYWKERLDRIRDIRSSEKVLYRQVLDLYATSVDYDSKAEVSLVFFKTVQNKLHYATLARDVSIEDIAKIMEITPKAVEKIIDQKGAD